MVPLELVSYKTIGETLNAYRVRNDPRNDVWKKIDRKNLYDFIRELVELDPEKEDKATEIEKRLNDIYEYKVKEEIRKGEAPRPTATTPANLSDLVSGLGSYFRDKAEADRLISNAKKSQDDWIKAQEEKRKIYIKPAKDSTPIKLTGDEAKTLSVMVDEANTTPEKSVAAISNKIEEAKTKLSAAYSPDVVEAAAPIVAADVAQNMGQLAKQLEGKTDSEKVEILKNITPAVGGDSILFWSAAASGRKDLTDLAGAYATAQNLKRDFVTRTYGDKLATILYGPKEIREFVIAAQGENGAFAIDIDKLTDTADGFLKQRKDRIELLESQAGAAGGMIVQDFGNFHMSVYQRDFKTPEPTDVAKSAFSTLGTVGGVTKFLGFNPEVLSYTRSLALLNEGEILFQASLSGVKVLAPLSETFALEVSLFPSLGVGLAPAVTGTTGAVATEAAATVAAGAEVATAAATGVAAALGNVIPIIGPIVSAAITWVATNIVIKVLPWIKRNLGKILVGMGGLLLFLGAPFSVLGIGLIAGGGIAMAGGVGGAIASAGAAIVGGLSVLGGAVLGAIAVPLTVALVTIPIMVALILFIINAGAYIVPNGGGVSSNPNSNVILCLPADGRISQLPYCESSQTATHCRYTENAYDISNTTGTAVYAATSGTVYYYQDTPDGSTNGGFGYYAEIVGNGYITYYGHMMYGSGLSVGSSKTVKAGDQIGSMDSTGNSGGESHVHFEMREPAGNIADAFGSATLNQQVQNLNNFPECLTK